MAILIKDGDALVNAGNVALKQSNIIDLYGGYGVEFVNTDRVTAIKNKYQSNKFRAKTGEEPILEGDYLKFDGNVRNLTGIGIQINKPFTLEFWYYTSISDLQIVFQQNFHSGRSRWYITPSDVGYASIRFSIESGEVSQVDRSYYNIKSPLYTWNHYIMQFDGDNYSNFINGYMNDVSYPSNVTFDSEGALLIGGIGTQEFVYVGYLNSIKAVAETTSELLNGWDGVSLKYAENQLVFTPPVYPNTIL